MEKVKVRLAFWYKGSKPGDVVEVSKDEANVMMRDGRVAEVLKPKALVEDKKASAETKDDSKKAGS